MPITIALNNVTFSLLIFFIIINIFLILITDMKVNILKYFILTPFVSLLIFLFYKLFFNKITVDLIYNYILSFLYWIMH